MRRISRALVLSISLCLLLGLLPAATLAAPRPTRFHARLYFPCVSGLAQSGAWLELDWRGASGLTKGSDTILTDSEDGSWQYCSDSYLLRMGDVLRATVAGVTHELIIPTLTLRLDRVTNVVYGRAPAGTTVRMHSPYDTEVTTNARGRWSYQEGSSDFYGGVGGWIEWHSQAGDLINVRAYAAQMIVWIGTARIDGWTMTPRERVSATLWSNVEGTWVSRATSQATSRLTSDFSGFFRKDGRRVQIQSGDRVTSPGLASDADWIVPEVTARVNVSTNVVRGHCSDSGSRLPYYHAAIVKTAGFGGSSVWGMLDGEGNFVVDFDNPAASPGVYQGSQPTNVRRGDELHIWCEQTTGDYAVQVIPIN